MGTTMPQEKRQNRKLHQQRKKIADAVGCHLTDGKNLAGKGDFLDKVGIAGHAVHASHDTLRGELPCENTDQNILHGHAASKQAQENHIDHGHEQGGQNTPQEPEGGPFIALLQLT